MADETPATVVEQAPDFQLPPRPERRGNPAWYKGMPAPEGSGRTPGTPNAKTQITHDAIIDFMIANPTATQDTVAQAFGFRSKVSIGIIMNSDAFQSRYIKRRGELADPLVTAALEDRLRGIAHRSAEIVAERLETSPGDFKFAMEALRVSSGSLIKNSPPSVNVGFVVHLPGPAASSDEWTRRFAPESGEVLIPRLDDAPSEAAK